MQQREHRSWSSADLGPGPGPAARQLCDLGRVIGASLSTSVKRGAMRAPNFLWGSPLIK